MAEFYKIEPKALMEQPGVWSFNPFETIGKEWYLITGGTMEHHNTMTASWGTMGIFWGKPVVNSFIRPQRYTYEFIEAGERFTLSFFGEEYRKALQFCGSHSGRDYDKERECGLTPVAFDGAVGYAEADTVLVCRKLYAYDIKPEEMLDPAAIEPWYPEKDYHRCYFAEVLGVYRKGE